MSFVQLSSTGRVACGGSFMDIYGRRPPATIQAVYPTGLVSPPSLMSWSAFPTPKKVRARHASHGDTNEIAAGEHVALAFSHVADASSQELFFAVGVFRCDTWALQWAVRSDSLGDGRRVCDVCCLSAHTVVFLESNAGGKRGSRKQLHVASRAEVPRVARRENRQWRSFLTKAHRVETKFESEDVHSIQALSATSCLLLTGAGRLIRVTVSFAPHLEATSEEVEVEGGRIAPRANSTCTLVLSSATGKEMESSCCYAAVFAAGSPTCRVMKLVSSDTAMKASNPQSISLPTGATVERVEFAGPHILVLILALDNKTAFALHMTCLVPSESSSSSSSESLFNCVSFAPLRMTAQRVPLATMYCSEKETHVVLVSRRRRDDYFDGQHEHNVKNNGIIKNNESLWWRFFEYAELPLQNGPYTEEEFRSATWCSLPEPCHTVLPSVVSRIANGDDNDDDNKENTAAHFQQDLALLTHSQSEGNWEPIRLHYALAATFSQETASGGKNNKVAVNVFAIETAPFVHTRLVKQWHNATRGLKFLLDGANNTVGGSEPFAVSWNPRHIRRALQLFSQEGLRVLFGRLANALRVSTETSNAASLFYGAAATAVTDVALQAVTLSRQVGAILSPEDVTVVALLLRASRETGHLIVNSTTRGRLLLESAVRSRLANHVLGGGEKCQKRSHGGKNTNANEEGEEDEVGAEFVHVPTELRVERALRTKYAPNAWTQHLLRKNNEYSAVVTGALQHLNAVASLQQQQQQQQQQKQEEQQEEEHAGRSGDGTLRPHQDEEMTATPALLPDWMTLGRRAHANAAFAEYESALLHPTAKAR
ncbi:hypothetical protein, conserved [Trypanosoma cruzi]|uniref:Uncharacterized protein n=1 Tax=Trypanosoma cruzi (strain CL Brener) TaxID=353153 RepID=Q4DBY1_TRYCC|nr:hypothetical protein, conserved [Trypanosoma cruzi]EAN90034.1 hypothetical protein, conserved [Trypanosoma cruzi]|eukprot:XP_811885.1 hypothetical protein [Trypanosoma cruzi strain CL Brener]